jgi:thiol-disulfide isomerase/thioredoxin
MPGMTDVMLVKASWCGHCNRFEPIFKNTEKYINNNSFFKEQNVNLKSFDFGDENIKKDFENKYGKITKYIEGFPTVIIRHENESKNNVKYTLIDTTHEDVNITENDRLNKATELFVTNIRNGYDSLLIQSGGNYEPILEQSLENKLSEIHYKKKYLFYKEKYTKLKNEKI